MRSVKTMHLKQKLSDHQPKQLTANLNFHQKIKVGEEAKRQNINWDRLREVDVAAKFRKTLDERLENKPEDIPWTELMEDTKQVGLECCGKKEKTALTPWLDNHKKELEDFRGEMIRTTKRVHEATGQEKETAREERPAEED